MYIVYILAYYKQNLYPRNEDSVLKIRKDIVCVCANKRCLPGKKTNT